MFARKMYSCQNNPEKSDTEKKTKHIPTGYSLFTNYSFDKTKNELGCYRGQDCMERFCKELRDHAMKIINYEEKLVKKISLIKCKNFVTYAKKNLVLMMTIKSIIKSEIIVFTLENLEELLIIFVI